MKKGELAKKKRKGCLTALLVVWAVFMVKVISVLDLHFGDIWGRMKAGDIAGFAYLWLVVFFVLLCCLVLWRIVPKGYFRKKQPDTAAAPSWAVTIPTHEGAVIVGNPFRGIFIAGAAGSGKSESVAVPLLLEFIRKGFAGIVYDFKFPALDNDITAFINATGSDLRHFCLNFSDPYRTDFVNPIKPEYVPNTSYAREYAVSIVANLTKESIKNPDFWSRSATDVLTACIWYLREEHPEICDIPHVLAMVGSNGTALLNTLQKNIITEQMVRSVYDALQRGADNQVSGVLGTLQGAVAQINTPEMMWVFSRDGCPHAAFVKGRFTLRVKNLLCSLRSCGIFYPSPLTNTLCFAGRCLGKKKKNVVLWRGVRFVILLPGFVRMVGDPPRSAGHAISFCHCRRAVFMV